MLIPYPGLTSMLSLQSEIDTSLLDHLLKQAGEHCPRKETKDSIHDYVLGLLSNIPRHNTWQMAEFAGHSNPFIYQNMLSRASWNQEAIRSDLIDEHCRFLANKKYSLIVDETGFIKKGKHSCGVQRQYSGTAGRIENCQVAVFLACTSKQEHCLIDTRLYLPKSWTDDPERCHRAGVPENVNFQTKTCLAEQMILSALQQGMKPEWVLGDSVYGESSGLRRTLEASQQPYVLGITNKHYVWIGFEQLRVSTLVKESLNAGQWETLACGAGTKGARLYQWCQIMINGCEPEGWSHCILFRKPVGSKNSDDIAIFRCSAPAEKINLQSLASAAGQRWAIETCFEEAKDLLGMDQYEVRNWNSWYRHMTLVMLAHTFLSLTRCCIEKKQTIPE